MKTIGMYTESLAVILILFVLPVPVVAKTNYHAGIAISYENIPRDASPLEHGIYSFNGVYVGLNNHTLSFFKRRNHDECNENITNYSYRNRRKNNLMWGVEFQNIDRDYSKKGCDIGAIIALPLPFIGYEIYRDIGKFQLRTSIEVKVYGVGVSVGFGL